jgi:adenosylcobinamide-phosphate synthase
MSLVLAFLVDLCFGDPQSRFHPVRIMGRMIEGGEKFLRRCISYEKLAGALLALILPSLVFLFVWFLLLWAGKIHYLLAQAINIFGIYTAISIHDLKKEAGKIFKDLCGKNLEKARKDLAGIVGRDTDHLDEKEIVRATVETVAESTVDGIIAPLFYAAIGGAPLALAYKAVNTLDSMIGHLNERYRDFGFIAAKQDMLINWIPARLSYVIIACASFLTGRMKQAFLIGWTDGIKSGENSSIPEATFAGALDIRLGGRNTYYGGKIVEKPFLGAFNRPLDNILILESVKLMLAASWLTLLACLTMNFGLRNL